MDLTLSVMGSSGHTEVRFTDDGAVLEWKNITSFEKVALRKLIISARKGGCKTHAVGEDGKPAEETKKLPGTIFSRSGKLYFKGNLDALKKIAVDAVENEIKSGKLVMEAQKDGTFNIVKLGSFVLKEKEPQKVASTVPPRGG
jgi:hypothetical protein